jgi:hypothetical protein
MISAAAPVAASAPSRHVAANAEDLLGQWDFAILKSCSINKGSP